MATLLSAYQQYNSRSKENGYQGIAVADSEVKLVRGMSHEREQGSAREDNPVHNDAFVMASAMAGAESSDQSMSSPTHSSKETFFEATSQSHPFEEPEETATPPSNSPVITPPARSIPKPSVLKEKDNSGSTGIPHVYHDYSQTPDVLDFARKKTGGVTQPFPEKLHCMLNAVDGTADDHIVSWLPHGRAFIVHKPREFTEQIMPRHFKQTKLTSFQRQLNLYGFRRLTQGPDAGAYYHERFLRARPALCQHMARQKVKGTGHKQPADAKTEPNFYSMRPVEPAPPPVHKFPEEDGHEAAEGQFDDSASFSYPNFEAGEPYSETTNATVVPMETNFSSYSRLPPVSFDSLSPASPGMTGAAHLLTGIAQGYTGNLSIPMDANLKKKRSVGDSSSRSESQHFLQPRLTAPSSSLRRNEEQDHA